MCCRQGRSRPRCCLPRCSRRPQSGDGVVDESSGVPLAGAAVGIEFYIPPDVDFEPPQAPVNTTTDADGRFVFSNIVTGPYTATVTLDGFQTLEAEVRANSAGIIYITGRGLDDTVEFRLPKILTQLEQLLGVEAFVGLDPNQITADLQASDDAFNSEDYRLAIAGYAAIVDALPQLSILHMRIGDARRAIGDLEGAITAYEEVLLSDPANTDAKAEIDQTRSMIEQEAPFSAQDFFNLAELALASQELSRAGMLYERAARRNPLWEKPVYGLGQVAQRQQNTRLAQERFEKVLELAPDSEEANLARAALAALAAAN